MNLNVYKLECITNLHVGSGDFNYGVIDNEVERDCLSENPVIHASGIKGALRDAAEKNKLDKIALVFGGKSTDKEDMQSGAYKFFDAQLLLRPLRVSASNEFSFIRVTTPEIINTFIETVSDFGFNPGVKKINEDFGKNEFLSNKPGIYIEGDEDKNKAGKMKDESYETLKALFGEGNYALVESFKNYKLPVVARNKLGKNNHLWYEEYVPHHSVFYTMVMSEYAIEGSYIPELVQFGGNASIGYGYTKITAFNNNNR